MRAELVNWILSCQNSLRSQYQDYPNITLLLDSFLGQFDSSANALINDKFPSLTMAKISFKRILRPDIDTIRAYKPNLKTIKSDFLFWPWMKSHARQLKTIIRALDCNSSQNIALISHNHLQLDILKGLDFGNQITFSKEEYDLSEALERFEYRFIRKSIIQSSKSLPNFKYDNIRLSFSDVIEHALQLHLHFFYVIELYKEMKAKIGFKGLFIGNDLTLQGRTAVLLANRDHIWTTSIMHGALKNPLWKHIIVNTFFVFGPKDVKSLSDVTQTDIVLSGSPQVDEVRKRKIGNQGASTILIAFSGAGHSISKEHHLEMIKEVFKAAINSDFKFLLRLHPKDKQYYYEALLKLPNVELVTVGSEDIYGSLTKAKLLITSASMTVLDAMLSNIPVVTLDLQEEVQYVDFISAGATTHVIQCDELLNVLNALLSADGVAMESSQRRQRNFLKEAFELKEEGSAQYIANFIDQKLKNAD